MPTPRKAATPRKSASTRTRPTSTTDSPTVIVVEAKPRPTFHVNLMGERYEAKPAKTGVMKALRVAIKDMEEDLGDWSGTDPLEIPREVNEKAEKKHEPIIEEKTFDIAVSMYGDTVANEIAERVDDPNDDLEWDHVLEMAGKVSAAAAPVPPTSRRG